MTLEQVNQEREPADLLRDEVIKKLQQVFPDKNVNSIVDSFLVDLLHRRNVPSMLHRMESEKQRELLVVEGKTLEDSIQIILADLPEDLVDFYRKKLEGGMKKNFDLF